MKMAAGNPKLTNPKSGGGMIKARASYGWASPKPASSVLRDGNPVMYFRSCRWGGRRSTAGLELHQVLYFKTGFAMHETITQRQPLKSSSNHTRYVPDRLMAIPTSSKVRYST